LNILIRIRLSGIWVKAKELYGRPIFAKKNKQHVPHMTLSGPPKFILPELPVYPSMISMMRWRCQLSHPGSFFARG
jgi:hypothetical protein